MLTDSHAHLDFVEDLDGVLDRAKKAGVSKIITIGTSVDCSKKCVDLAEKYSTDELQIYATCGIHPEDGKGDIEKYGSINKCVDELKSLAKSSKKIAGIGETGLDYFTKDTDRGVTTVEDKNFQRELFEEQIKLASDLDLPLVVHCRNAWTEIFELIAKSGRERHLSGVFHSWTGDLYAMKKALELGFYISFSGIVTFKSARDIQEVAKSSPIDRILVETDSPFLSPEPFRGQKNESANVRITMDFISSIRNELPAMISEATSVNSSKLFRLG